MYSCNCKNYPYCFEPQHKDELDLLLSNLSPVAIDKNVHFYQCAICRQNYRIEFLSLGVLVLKEQVTGFQSA
ncbi:hypothetical protein [Pseudoteredinibacter isoporae]|uniref:Uncharacterized protein n=1 Tax=Pseudoteredinibacter isoporae TaxID=570281 RepID=A0A7X0JWL6_9GAMM|nr:hypothetical protein [Pseudoteredinibacter isoporae]MBB6523058.1 hypothetical protein [Pseudoteredinibacter isoporae]NHO88578.1 hypothetical protein [Pseudoteredinibacter isoporae]NIB22731.1 hypothetical protein [Pseudoteredinibacter isoporae]